jgi:TRAP-type C4-dicarboxylate transport system permease small subunit
MRATANIVVRVIVFMAFTAGVIWLVLLGLSIADIIRRGVGASSFLPVAEFTEIVQVIPLFLGLAFAEYTLANVRTSIVTSRLKARTANIVRALAMAGVVAFVALMTFALTEKAIISTQRGEFRFGVGQVLVWPSRIVAAIGAFALLLVCIVKLVDLIRISIAPALELFMSAPEEELEVHI